MKAPIRIAILEALKSNSRVKMACVLAKGNRIISTGNNNMLKSHPWGKGHRKTHAEMAACRGLRPYDLKGCTAYICRVSFNGELSLAKPCAICLAILHSMGIKKIFYTNKNEWMEL